MPRTTSPLPVYVRTPPLAELVIVVVIVLVIMVMVMHMVMIMTAVVTFVVVMLAIIIIVIIIMIVVVIFIVVVLIEKECDLCGQVDISQRQIMSFRDFNAIVVLGSKDRCLFTPPSDFALDGAEFCFYRE